METGSPVGLHYWRMHQTLVERGLCLRQPTDKGNLLVFPSYYRRQRKAIVHYPVALVVLK